MIKMLIQSSEWVYVIIFDSERSDALSNALVLPLVSPLSLCTGCLTLFVTQLVRVVRAVCSLKEIPSDTI